jgi:hypothetical protein
MISAFGLPTKLVPWNIERLGKPFDGTTIIQEFNFPHEYELSEMFVMSDHHHSMERWDTHFVRSTFDKHFRNNWFRFDRHGPAQNMSDQKMILFLKDLLRADHFYPGLNWVGFAITMRHAMIENRPDVDIEYFLMADRRGVSVPVVKADAL